MKTSDDLYHFRDNVLNEVSPSFCTAKWKQVTLHLHSGQTHSCHHPVPHKIPLDEIDDNPSALHNTKFKKLQRKEMLEGKRPSECDYCWRVEDCNPEALSDRVYKSAEPWARNFIDEIISKPWDDDVDPSYLEVSFSHVCNLKCSYCSPQVSSKWVEEIQQHGAYKTSSNFNDLDWIKKQGTMPIPNREHNPYVEAFWKWWPSVSSKLHTFRITGGEPLLSKDTFKILDYLIENPLPNLEFSINSNMCLPDAVIDKFIEKIKIICNEGKVKNFKIFTSAEAHGTQAEYIRYGLNYNKWIATIRRILTEVPNCTFTCMSTYNLLSMFSFDKFLQDILSIKTEFGGLGKPTPIILDVPYLRWPDHQTIKIAPKEWTKNIAKQLEFIRSNLENVNVKNGFHKWEGDKFSRLLEVFDNENLTQQQLDIFRKDFAIFVDEHDRRRSTNFLKTFPEMEQFYQDCKLIT